MRKKGFTLIELLAVIVVLAIIALIATPMVLNTIEEAREGSAKSSGYSYVTAVDTALATYMLRNSGVSYNTGKYDISTLATDLEVALKGDTPSEGNICIGSDGTVTKASLKINGYVISYDGKVIVSTDLEEIEDISCDGTSEETPEEETPEEVNYTGIPAGEYAKGNSVTYVGVDWYVVNDNGDNVTLITKENAVPYGLYGSTVSWEDSYARTQVTNWFNSNNALVSDRDNSGLLLVHQEDYVRLPVVSELDEKIKNDSGTPFWTMSTVETSSGKQLYIGAADGTRVETTEVSKGVYYHDTGSIGVSGGYSSNRLELYDDATTGALTVLPSVSQIFPKTVEAYSTATAPSISYKYISKHIGEAATEGEYTVCFSNVGVSNATLEADVYYALGDETCREDYTIYEIKNNSVVGENIGYRSVITVKER